MAPPELDLEDLVFGTDSYDTKYFKRDNFYVVNTSDLFRLLGAKEFYKLTKRLKTVYRVRFNFITNVYELEQIKWNK